jgi:aspartyl-tRNA(Asn)/glutamyl-tRNA(Gln) amidotransferase subunit C
MGRDGVAPRIAGVPAPGGAVFEEQVRRVANLARLGLTDGEVGRMVVELAAILQSMERIRELDLRGVPPMASPLDLRNALRPDEPARCLTQEEALLNAPEKADGFFAVPRLDG